MSSLHVRLEQDGISHVGLSRQDAVSQLVGLLCIGVRA
jgi:hypothetical protein